MDWNVTPALHLFYKFYWDYNISTGGTAVSPFQNLNWTTTNTVGFNYSQSRMTRRSRLSKLGAETFRTRRNIRCSPRPRVLTTVSLLLHLRTTCPTVATTTLALARSRRIRGSCDAISR
jgi:hypothetical protein